MRTTEQVEPQAKPERFVILANPVSANAKRIGRQIRELERADILPVRVVETHKDSRHTSEALADVLRAGDWLGIGAGDGMVNFAVSNMNGTPITPMAGGNANDVAHMLHTKHALRQPRHVLEHGRVVSAYPLFARITPPDEEAFTKLAAGYISFGASARAAHDINETRGNFLRKIPGIKKLYIGSVACAGLAQAESFKLADTTGVHSRYDLIFPKGDRMAESTRWQTHLTVPETQQIVIPEKRLLKVATAIGQSLVGNLTGPELLLGESYGFTLQDNTYMQIDGEDTELHAGTAVEIGVWPQPYEAITTKIAA